IRHVNEHGITFQEYRFNEYKNQIEKIAFYLGHETVAKWYGDYGKLSCSLENDLRWYPALI
ncbi:hypothetical protein ACSLOE_30545, partial [Escherichia coli]